MMNYFDKWNKTNMLLNNFSDKQLDEVIKILKGILTLTIHPDWITPEIRTDIHNKVIESINKIENMEIQQNKE